MNTTNITKDSTFFGHPVALSTLFASEMWERFSYYGMRALLVLFLTATYAENGFGMSELDAFTVYGIFTGLVYITPIIGGLLADKLLGERKCIYIGGLTMAMGQFLISAGAIPGDDMALRHTLFYSGLGLLILGNGFFKPNVSTMVGQLYDNNDPRKDGGFTIFYMGINIGAFFSPLIAGRLGEQVAWHYGFLSAGIGMLIGTTWFLFRSHTLGHIGMPPKRKDQLRLAIKDWFEILGYLIFILAIVFIFIFGWKYIPGNVSNTIIYIAIIAAIIYLLREIIGGTKGKTEWSRVGVIMVLAIFNIFFWGGYEQAGSTFNVFARDNTQRMIGNWEIPASWFQCINAVFIVVFAPLFSIMWTKLEKYKLNPSTPMKFAWGMILLCVGFIIMAIGYTKSVTGAVNGVPYLVSPLWLVLVYLILTWGELCLSPIGLSMVTKLSPKKISAMMMGIWMCSFSAGSFMASQMKAISIKLQDAFQIDIQVFWMIAIQSAIISIILIAVYPWLKRMMKGIK